MELRGKVQHYDWGKLGKDSMVAELVAGGDPTATIEPEKPYAELWLGTHVNGPAMIVERDVLLSEYLKDNHDAIGPVVKRQFGVQLPFLLKVLSIKKPLSIQAHPDKALAEQLHSQFPDLYKDSNHKPELAVALTPFELLCGFRPYDQIKEFIDMIPEVGRLIPPSAAAALVAGCVAGRQASARPALEALLTADKDDVERSLTDFLARVDNQVSLVSSSLVSLSSLVRVVRELRAAHGGEAGCWAPLLMNHLTLEPGQSVFLKANLPHAYLSGDCIEVMANSDNVVRAGLTSKRVDVATLLPMLDYSPLRPRDLLLSPSSLDDRACQWTPPVPDFKLIKIVVEAGGSYNTAACPAPGVALVTRGAGGARDTREVPLRRGSALFLKAHRQVSLTAALDTDTALEVYIATVNVDTPPTHDLL